MQTQTLRDHGIGVSPDVVTKVFDRFYRADPARKRSLAIAAEVIASSAIDAARALRITRRSSRPPRSPPGWRPG